MDQESWRSSRPKKGRWQMATYNKVTRRTGSNITQRSRRIFWTYSLTLVLLLALLSRSRPKWESSPIVYNQSKYCGRSDIRRGQWVREDNLANSYQWSLDNEKCQYNNFFRRDAFCGLMENQVILFIGDSLTKEMWRSLVALTDGVDVPSNSRPELARTCSNKTQLNYWRSNRFDDLQHAISDRFSLGPIELRNRSSADFPTAIVMNTGSWYQSTDVYISIMVKTLKYVRDWQEICKKDSLLGCPFVWRTTPPGMLGCMEYNQPMNNITRAEELLVDGTSGAAAHLHPHLDKYHWTGFREQNLIAEELLTFSGWDGLDYEIIDGYEIGITRPDNHVSEKDCLHHPNENLDVPDAYNTVLLHYLLSMAFDREKMHRSLG